MLQHDRITLVFTGRAAVPRSQKPKFSPVVSEILLQNQSCRSLL